MFSHNRFSFGGDGAEGNLRAAPVVGPGGRGGAPTGRPNDRNSTTKITHSIFFYPSVSTFTSAAYLFFQFVYFLGILIVFYFQS